MASPDPDQTKMDIAQRFKSLCKYCLYDILADNIVVKVFLGVIRKLASGNPKWYIETAGPFLWKYRKQIEEHDFEFFINHDYEAQKRDWQEITGGYGPPIPDSIVDHIRNTIRYYRDNNPDLVTTTANAMLKLYSQYILLCKSNSP